MAEGMSAMGTAITSGAGAPGAGYKREAVLRMTKVSARQLTEWEKSGLVTPEGSYDFEDLRTIKALHRLREHGVKTGAVRRILDSIRRRLGEIEKPLANMRITKDGRRITVHVAGGPMDLRSGQMLLDFNARGVEEFRAPAPKVESESGKELEAEHWFQRGLALEETGAPVEQAAAAYRKAIEANPHAAGALVNLGTIAFRLHRLRDAEAFYRRAVEADPAYPLAQFNMGNLYDEQGLYEDARRHYLEALRLNPRYGDAVFNLALLCERSNELLKAIHYWQTYLKLDPGSSWAGAARKQLEKLKAALRQK
jgi:Tfp pilus assembly protein PilF